MVTVGKSLTIDSPINIQRISYANGDLVEAVAINPKEVLINGKAPGETSLIVWQQNGNRLLYDLTVRLSPVRLDAVRQQIARDFPDDDINVTFDNDTAFVRGTVKDVISADRVMAMVPLWAKPSTCCASKYPRWSRRSCSRCDSPTWTAPPRQHLGVNLASAAFNQSTGITTGQFGTTQIDQPGTSVFPRRSTFCCSARTSTWRHHPGAGSQEPAGDAGRAQPAGDQRTRGELPCGRRISVPDGRGQYQLGAVTIDLREYGIRLNFLPKVTPRGTIRLKVTPEVSSLDFTNGCRSPAPRFPRFPRAACRPKWNWRADRAS